MSEHFGGTQSSPHNRWDGDDGTYVGPAESERAAALPGRLGQPNLVLVTTVGKGAAKERGSSQVRVVSGWLVGVHNYGPLESYPDGRSQLAVVVLLPSGGLMLIDFNAVHDGQLEPGQECELEVRAAKKHWLAGEERDRLAPYPEWFGEGDLRVALAILEQQADQQEAQASGGAPGQAYS